MSAAEKRRLCLRVWLRGGAERNGLTTREIVRQSGLYPASVLFGWTVFPEDRCRADLAALAAAKVVRRHSTRPARWSVTS